MSLNRKMRRQAQRASEKNANVFKRSRFNEQPENGQEDESFIKNMLGSISKSPFMKKVLLNAIGLTLMAAPAAVASEIEAIGHTTVNTTAILDSNNQSTGHYNYDITTGNRQYLNGIDLNAFKKFNLDNGDVANFFKTVNANNSIQKDAPIINFVQEKININGVVNCIESLSHDKREIGGRLFFISSNGILIGSTGVINTGCFYAIVPNEEFVNKFVNFADEVHPFETSKFLKYVHDDYNDAVFFNDNDSSETYAQKQARLDNLITRNISSITLSDTAIIEVNGTINAKRNVELLAGKTYKSGETDIDKSASIIIGPNAHINTYSYDTRQDFVMSALNLNESDTQAINSAMELYENDYSFENNEDNGKNPFGIRIRAIGQDGTAPTANGYATAIKSEGTLTSQKNVEFITEMATENATAKNAVQIAGNVTADNEFKVSGDYEYSGPDQNGSYVTTYNGDVVLGTSNKAATINSKALHIQANNISDEGTKKNIINAEGSTFQYWDHAWANFSADNNIALTNTEINTTKELGVSSKGSAKINGAIESSSVIVKSEKGIELGNITAKGLEEDHVTGKIILENNTSGEIVANKLQADGWIKDSNEQWSFQSGLGNVTVDNGNKQNVNYNNYSTLSGQDVELKEVKGKAIGLSGYNVTADKIVTNTSASVVAGGKFTLGEDNQQAFYNADATLTAEARSIETKGSVTAKSISLNSRKGANLGGALTTTNGDINVQNYGNDSTEGDITIGGNVIARKEENEQTVNADVRINTMFNSNTATKGGKITINGEVSGKEVNIWSFGREQTSENHGDDVTLNGDVNADGMLLLAGKNVTVASGKNLNSGTSINILAKDKFDAKNSNIEAGQALSIDATDIEVKTTKSGGNTQFDFENSFVAHGDIKAGNDLRIGNSWTVTDNQNNSYWQISDSIVLEGNTYSGYSENNENGPLTSEYVGGTSGDTYFKARTINSAGKNTSAGSFSAKGGDAWGAYEASNDGTSIILNEVESKKESDYIGWSTTEIVADTVKVNSVTSDGGVKIEAETKATVTTGAKSTSGNVIVSAGANGEAEVKGASAFGKLSVGAGKVAVSNSSAQLAMIVSAKGSTVSNLETSANNADVSESYEYNPGYTTSVKGGVYIINQKMAAGKNEDNTLITVAPTGEIALSGNITSHSGITVNNNGGDVVIGKGADGSFAKATITGNAGMTLKGTNIVDNSGSTANELAVLGGSSYSLNLYSKNNVELKNTDIETSGGRFYVSSYDDTMGAVSIAHDIVAREVNIEANKGIEVGNVTAEKGNIYLNNKPISVKVYSDASNYDWKTQEATGDVIVNGNLTATLDTENTDYTSGNIEINSKAPNGNVTMKNATGKTIEVNANGKVTAGVLTATLEEQEGNYHTKTYTGKKQAVDENGNPVYDEEGYPVYQQAVDENGNPAFDEYDNPIYVEEEKSYTYLNRTYDVYVSAEETDINKIKSNNEFAVSSSSGEYYKPDPDGLIPAKKIKVGDIEARSVYLKANEGIEAGNITVGGNNGVSEVVISNENLYQGHYVEPTEIEGGNGSLRKGSSENWSWTYTPPTGTVKVSSVKFKSRTTPTKIKKIGKIGKYAFKIKNSSLLETPQKGEEESSSSSMYEEYKDATLDPNFKGGENGGVKVGSIEGESVQIISDHGISVGQINTEPLAEENNEQPTPAENELPAENEDYSVNLINRLTDDVVAEMIGNDFEPTLRAEPTDGSAAGSIIAKNGGIRIENQAEGGKITLGDVEGTVVYMKAKGKVSMANVTATKNGDNTFESPAVKPLYIESEGDDVVISGNIEAVGGREIKSRTGGYVTPEKEQDKPIVVPEEAPKSQEEAKQVIEDVAGEKGVEEIDRTVNGNQENTDNSSNQEVSQVNDVSSLSDMGSDNIGGFEEMGSDAGGVDVGLSEGSAEFSMGADGSFEVASVGGAEDTGSGADAGTASDGGMAPNDGAMAEDNTASNDGAMAEDNTAPNDGAMAEDNTASDESAVANDNTDSDTGNGEGSNSESSAEEGNDEKGEETASVDSSEEENEDNDKSGRPGKGKPGKEKNGGNKKLTQFRSMLHQAKDSATQQRR